MCPGLRVTSADSLNYTPTFSFPWLSFSTGVTPGKRVTDGTGTRGCRRSSLGGHTYGHPFSERAWSGLAETLAHGVGEAEGSRQPGVFRSYPRRREVPRGSDL